MLSIIYTVCRKQAHYAECHHSECRYAERHYAECRGTNVRWYRSMLGPSFFDVYGLH